MTWLLPRDFRVYADFRQDSFIQPERDEYRNSGFQFTFRLAKLFSWGESAKVAGLRAGVDAKVFGIVEGVVFNDLNQNGIQDPGEEGIPGISISLEDGSKVLTDEKGTYRFPRVETGKHSVILDVRKIPAEYSIISPARAELELKVREMIRVDFRMVTGGRIEGSNK